MVAPVPITNPVIEVLIDQLWLPVSVSEDRQQTGAAIADLLHYLLTREIKFREGRILWAAPKPQLLGSNK